MPFSPSTHLISQGWEGPGHGLRKGALKKPVTVAHKTNLKGIGKERDTGYAWWDDVFSAVANKSRENSASPDIRRTSTGIFSSLPPSSTSTSGASTPVTVPHASTSTSETSFHTDIIATAKLEAARRELYSRFMRGRPLAGTTSEEEDRALQPTASTSAASANAVDAVSLKTEPAPSGDKAKRKQHRAQRRVEKEERRRLRAEKKAAKAERTGELIAQGKCQINMGDGYELQSEDAKKCTDSFDEILEIQEPAVAAASDASPGRQSRRTTTARPAKRKREKQDRLETGTSVPLDAYVPPETADKRKRKRGT